MKVNFKIRDNYAIETSEYFLDMHNDYDLVSINYDLVNNTFVLIFERNQGDWVAENHPKMVKLIHSNILYSCMDDSNQAITRNDIKTITNITYLPDTYRTENRDICNVETPCVNDDILYMLESGLVVRIKCEEIEVVIN